MQIWSRTLLILGRKKALYSTVWVYNASLVDVTSPAHLRVSFLGVEGLRFRVQGSGFRV